MIALKIPFAKLEHGVTKGNKHRYVEEGEPYTFVLEQFTDYVQVFIATK